VSLLAEVASLGLVRNARQAHSGSPPSGLRVQTRAMMGEPTVMQEALFYEFSIERHIPADHLLRAIDRFVDLSGLRIDLRPFYSEIGRPSIDPELMIRMLIIGYCFGIRSERRLCQEVHLDLAYRWFCRLGLEGNVLTTRLSRPHQKRRGSFEAQIFGSGPSGL
jgi:transposase